MKKLTRDRVVPPLEPRYEPPQGSAMHFLRDRIMIGQLVLEIAIELNS
jgi:hypothetical protein